MPSNNGKRVAVIGAGAAGLAAAKYLLAEGFLVTIFERKAGPGGVWNTAPGNGPYLNPVYEGLETNVPRTLMTLSDHPWPQNASLFPRSEVVGEYLQGYAATMQQGPYSANLTMRPYTEVTEVRKSRHHMTDYWKVEALQRTIGSEKTETVDYFLGIVVALGNYHEPYVPEAYMAGAMEWLEHRPGTLIHSVEFCKPEAFRDQKVLVVGNNASGFDVSLQLKDVAEEVLVSSRRSGRNGKQGPLSAPNLTGKPGIRSFNSFEDSVTFTDSTKSKNVDRIILCTGYLHDFSFIKKRTGDEKIFEKGHKIPNLYEHIFWIPDQTLAFVGLPDKSAAFTVAEAQSAVVARAFAQRIPTWAGPGLECWQRDADARWEQSMRGPDRFTAGE
ncbi:Flavin-containing monooxygenase FMO GS-OX5 [Elasticomyces elasticus]|uniref:Flavin-containing monooxygenase FMO GS-OX5 n=1 Tax=Elasticomyces elasticus TaxID=574655 RepID=A0AAN7VLN2_9PEZI|nr:Flavin-containing monooxygenase FMO GS-OX5 [Elasticomyces elasticus]